ncbi:HDIG domain-containing protein [Bacteroidales bacterium OttesenSCG-928-K03]|nr:HDIG domain-containing protein [Odoribacter sp. OttesenSCG-928-L07]MDL2239849.1 HDIG domain-containing protein [Bacteroidales bacterium OttesenSCG-928-L14]MDL2242442.1 HDIG domain-containing protein [Bacteroidales bacterium OttesenSCG-928-K03]
MDIINVIEKYFPPETDSYKIYIQHVKAVANAVEKICDYNKHLNIDKSFVKNAALLHDIGICMVDAPKLHCYGFVPYIQHGIMGRLILEDEKLEEYALVCERHIGTGIFKDDIISNKLPLPIKDMYPISIEEKVVAYADKFFSKSQNELAKPKAIEDIKNDIAKYGKKHLIIFDEWCKLFGYKYIY